MNCSECGDTRSIDGAPCPHCLPLPEMNVSLPAIAEKMPLAQGEAAHLSTMYHEIMSDIDKNENQIDGVLNNFIDMVMNGGDSSSSTKESVVNLIKNKTDLADKKIKVMEMMMKVYLRDAPKVSATQNNKITIQDMRGLIGDIKKSK